jgi:phage baseplate assembly protein W
MVYKTETAISLPFSIDPYGKVAQTTDQTKIWADKVRSVIGTALRERVMRPTFGTDIPSAVFENQEDADGRILELVSTSFNNQLPRLDLQSVSNSFDQYSGTLTVDITYALPNEEIVSTTVGLIVVSGTLIPYEEPQ